MLLCYLAMLNATLEYNTSLARMQHVKRESDYKENVAVQISGRERYSREGCLPTLQIMYYVVFTPVWCQGTA